MMLSISIAALLFLSSLLQTPEGDERNVFLDLGSEHCASELAFAAYEHTAQDELATPAMPAYITYSAYEFETSERAEAALDDIPELVAETFSGDPDFSEQEDYDRLVTEVETEEYGDRSIAYIMTLPPRGDDLDSLTIELLGIVNDSQLLLVLMFSDIGTTTAAPGVTLVNVPPFAADLDQVWEWDGTGDVQDAIPAQEEMPIGWEGQEVTIDEFPECD
jgi:hypothetical protein